MRFPSARKLTDLSDLQERLNQAAAIYGKRVYFAHDREGEALLVTKICDDGMVEIEHFPGEFSPHIFVVAEGE